MKKHLLQIIQIHMKAFTLISLIFLMGFNGYAQQAGDYRSVGGTSQNPKPWLDAGTWEKYDGTTWNTATDYPLSATFSGTVFIQPNTFVVYNVTSQTNGFNLAGAIIIHGNFLVNIPENSNTTFAGDIDVFELNAGGVFRTTFSNNPQLEVRINELFRINGGELRYQDGKNNSALYIECKGDVEVNGGLVINDTNSGLNDSGLYMSGNGTQANPQHLKITSNVSTLARKLFFATSSTYIVEEYAGSIEQNTVSGEIADPRSGYVGLQNKGNVLTINNSSTN
ncbi:hypothetical protein LB452_12260 [Psychroflexus sp. CAK8W]|uniref:Right handed beta helix region n=1 Tax=Psychroflexus longus TaxID=2873596 RepID=A0ABS7XL32_9FLAO|nr:hypothetical protein [Psychroflexus longus]MBZ9779697.1 hypothetical protein [Psychroflexus longus]